MDTAWKILEKRINTYTDPKYIDWINETKKHMITELRGNGLEKLGHYILLIDKSDIASRTEGITTDVRFPNYIIEVDTRPYKRSKRGWSDTSRVAGWCSETPKIVSINPKLCRTKKQFQDTLIHELLHVLAIEVHDEHGHTGWWKKLADIFGETRCHNYKNPNRDKACVWKLECHGCKQEWYKARMRLTILEYYEGKDKYIKWPSDRYCVKCSEGSKTAWVTITNRRKRLTKVDGRLIKASELQNYLNKKKRS